MGDRDWLFLLHLWGGPPESDRSSSSPAGHRQGWHRSRSPGPFYITSFNIQRLKNDHMAMVLMCYFLLCCRFSATGRPTENPRGPSCWQLVSARAGSSLPPWMQWLPSSPCEDWNKVSDLLPFIKTNSGRFQSRQCPCYFLNNPNARFYELSSSAKRRVCCFFLLWW